ncbi:MAG: ABC transporter ATP-binding protein [Pseudomonadota bacterium]
MTKLVANALTVTAGEKTLVRNATFDVTQGELIIVLGPNGAGKTSMIRSVLGLTPLAAGTATLNGVSVAQLSARDRAQSVAYLPQIRPLAWPNQVRDIVALGRFSHGAALGRLSQADADAVSRAIAACDLTHLAHRTADTLSGGELARVHCARAIATEAPLLIADEPTAALDPRHQFRILDLIKTYVDTGAGALLVLHDIDLAARYATRLIWMKDGEIIADGSPADTLSSERLAEVYQIDARVENGRVLMEGIL